MPLCPVHALGCLMGAARTGPPPRSRMKAKRKASRMAFLLHLNGMGMGLCTLVVYACIKVGAESEAADYAG